MFCNQDQMDSYGECDEQKSRRNTSDDRGRRGAGFPDYNGGIGMIGGAFPIGGTSAIGINPLAGAIGGLGALGGIGGIAGMGALGGMSALGGMGGIGLGSGQFGQPIIGYPNAQPLPQNIGYPLPG